MYRDDILKEISNIIKKSCAEDTRFKSYDVRLITDDNVILDSSFEISENGKPVEEYNEEGE